jgi:hypothetical protein
VSNVYEQNLQTLETAAAAAHGEYTARTIDVESDEARMISAAIVYAGATIAAALYRAMIKR